MASFPPDRAPSDRPDRDGRAEAGHDRPPRARVTVVDSDLAEVRSYLDRPAITAGDIHRLCTILEDGEGAAVRAAGLVLQVALVKPKHSGRRRYLASHRPQLLEALVEAGLIEVS
jgi:hypothetical protein